MPDKRLARVKKEEFCYVKIMPKIEEFYQKTAKNVIVTLGTVTKK